MAFGKKTSFFGRMTQRIEDVLLARPTPDEDMLDELEEVLITSDMGMETTEKIIERLKDSIEGNLQGIHDDQASITKEISSLKELLTL